MLQVSEIFYSIQGESTFAGLPCVFIRLAGCNLDCYYCDTGYARAGGEDLSQEEILSRVEEYGCPLVEITGGEPLIQEEAFGLIEELVSRGFRVLVETNGTVDIGGLHPAAVAIMDIKCPGSGETGKIRWDNLEQLRPDDELKFVLSSRRDYLWARKVIREKIEPGREILLSPVTDTLKPADLAGWILEDHLDVRLHLQLHTVIWPDKKRGV